MGLLKKDELMASSLHTRAAYRGQNPLHRENLHINRGEKTTTKERLNGFYSQDHMTKVLPFPPPPQKVRLRAHPTVSRLLPRTVTGSFSSSHLHALLLFISLL